MLSQTFLKEDQCLNRRTAKLSFLTFFIRLLKTVLIRLERNENERQSRREIRELLKLSQYELRDMGITRGDVHYALSRSLEVSAGELLGHKRKASSRGKYKETGC